MTLIHHGVGPDLQSTEINIKAKLNILGKWSDFPNGTNYGQKKLKLARYYFN